MRLQGKVVLVTGAASGIGRAIAEGCAREGAKVVIGDLDDRRARSAAREITRAGGTATALAIDVTDEEVVEAGVDAVVEACGGVDVLVNAAAVRASGLVDALEVADWRRVLTVVLDGAFLTTRACLRAMYRRGRGGSIVYLGASYGPGGGSFEAPYAAATEGLVGLCRTVAMEGSKHGVRANVVSLDVPRISGSAMDIDGTAASDLLPGGGSSGLVVPGAGRRNPDSFRDTVTLITELASTPFHTLTGQFFDIGRARPATDFVR